MAGVVVSADSHVMEPATLWTERLDKKFQDRAPKVVKTESGTFSFVAPGIVPFPVAAGFGIGKNGAELREHLSKGYEAARPSGWDPVERLEGPGCRRRARRGALHHAGDAAVRAG